MVDNNKPIAAVCHGPVALAAASLVRSPWPFAGKNMTVFSTPEEQIMEAVWGAKIGMYPQVPSSQFTVAVLLEAPPCPH